MWKTSNLTFLDFIAKCTKDKKCDERLATAWNNIILNIISEIMNSTILKSQYLYNHK